jgi:transcriptional regulator
MLASMYVPKSFGCTDENELLGFARSNSFATVVTRDETTGITATHVPVLIDAASGAWTIRGHIARANSQRLEGDALVIFSGPHAYISPTWYVEPNRVPTWNYVAVHVTGRIERLEGADDLRDIVKGLTRQHEASMPRPWPGHLPSDIEDKLLRAIVGFRVMSTDIRGAFKLSQRDSTESKTNVVAALRERGSDDEMAIADLMAASLV